jgi:hypothetical protein
MPVTPVVELEGVSFAYRPGQPVLSGVDLTVAENEFVAVAGPNGGGKTTLIRLVLGLTRPAAGSARLFGEPAHRCSRRATLGYVAQRARIGGQGPITVREVVSAGRLAQGSLLGPLRARDRATVWGRPTDDYPVEQLVFDAIDALIHAETSDLDTASAAARRIAAVTGDLTDDGLLCEGYLIAGETLHRAGDATSARRCFGRLLRHRAGAIPEFRANGLDALAGTLDAPDQRVDAVAVAAVAAAIRARHGLVTPPWLTVAIHAQERLDADPASEPLTSSLTDDEAIALALTFDGV